MRCEPRIWFERGGGPLPYLAETHLRAGSAMLCIQRRQFPLGFGRQPPAGPAAPRLRLVPRHVDCRRALVERIPAAEALLLPPAAGRAPVARPAGACALPPGPALGAPVFLSLVTA